MKTTQTTQTAKSAITRRCGCVHLIETVNHRSITDIQEIAESPGPGSGQYLLDETASRDFGDDVTLDESGDHAQWIGRTLQGSALAQRIRDVASSKKPVKIVGARIEGEIPLSYVDLNGLSFTHCLILGTVDIEGSTVDFLDLSSSRLVPTRGADGHAIAINALGVHVKHEVVLIKTHASGELFFPAAQVEGCYRACGFQGEVSELAPDRVLGEAAPDLDGHDTWAIDLSNADLKHDFDLTEAALRGGLMMAGAAVGGQFHAPNLTITALDPADKKSFKRFALWAQRASIAESVLLPHGSAPTSAAAYVGVVSFRGAKIGGNLDLTRASFDRGTNIEGFTGFERLALDLQSVQAEALVLRQVKLASGEVSLKDAHVNRLSDDPASWRGDRYSLSGFTYDNVDTNYLDRDGNRQAWAAGQRRSWLKRGLDSAAPGPYLVLAAAYGKLGDPRNQRKALIQGSSKAATRAEKVGLGWVRYGYRPQFVVFPLILLILVTIGFFTAAKHTPSGIVESKASDSPVAVAHCNHVTVSCPDALAYAVDAVIPASLGQTDAWRPNDGTAAGSRLAWMLRIDAVLSWLLAGVLVASVAGVLKRT